MQGTKNLIDWLSPNPPKNFIYTSSTSVYGQTDGSQVKESSPAEPASETGKILVETERLLLEAAQSKKIPAIILAGFWNLRVRPGASFFAVSQAMKRKFRARATG